MLNEVFVNEVVSAVRNLLPGMIVEAQEVVKNNDVVLHGILIRKRNENTAPTCYIDNYTNNGNDISNHILNVQRIAKEIVDDYHTHESPMNFSNIGELIADFSKVKSLLRIRLVNKRNNKKLFETLPYMPFLDMAIIAEVAIGTHNDNYACVKVTRELLDHWGYATLSDILPIAKKNTFHTPYTLQNMAEIMAEMAETMGLPKEMVEHMAPPMYVLTNEMKLNGATEICNFSTMQEIADRFESDLYVLPSSIHEVIILPKNVNFDVNELTSMVQAVNGTEVRPEEVLSDHVYIFSREDGWDYESEHTTN